MFQMNMEFRHHHNSATKKFEKQLKAIKDGEIKIKNKKWVQMLIKKCESEEVCVLKCVKTDNIWLCLIYRLPSTSSEMANSHKWAIMAASALIYSGWNGNN